MHIAEQKILNKFKKEPTREISTTELSMEVEDSEFKKILSDINSQDKKISNNAKRLKGKIHRKTLYHLNSLVKEGVLKVSSLIGRGEKQFCLAIDQGEIIVKKKHRQITISKPNIVETSLIDKYEKNQIIQRYDQPNWITKVNAILIKPSENEGLHHFYSKIYDIFSEINDVIGIYEFEKLIDKNNTESINEILKQMDIDTRDLDRRICLIIDLKKITNEEKILNFSKEFCKLKPRTLSIVYRGTNKDLRDKNEFLKKTCEHFWLAQIKFNFQNTTTRNSPVIIGKAGTYGYDEQNWQEIDNNNTRISCISNLSVSIDISKYYNTIENIKEFRDIMKKIAITMLKASNLQMKRSNDYFKKINFESKQNQLSPFLKQKAHIRIWNYDLKNKKQINFLQLLESTIEEIKEYCQKEREIYSSCGLPTSFDISFSTTFSKFSENLSKRNYAKATIKKFTDFEDEEITSFLITKEKLTKLFNGEDRARIFRKGDFEPQSITRELVYITSSYELNLLTYDFRETTNEMKLTNFMHGEN